MDDDGNVTTERLMGKAFVGYVGATFFIVNSLASFLWGRFIPKIGRRPLFIVTFITHAVYFAAVITLTQSLLG